MEKATEVITNVQILGCYGCALMLIDHRLYILKEDMDKPTLAMPMDNVNMLFQGASDRIVEISDKKIELSWVKRALILEANKARALSMTIAGIDPQEDPEIRILAISEAEELLKGNKHKNIRRFLRKRFLAKPPTTCADVAGAIAIATDLGLPNTQRLYREYQDQWK